jgi:Zn-ribbon-containing, possibly nucleic-acid-binding protein (DUF2310)
MHDQSASDAAKYRRLKPQSPTPDDEICACMQITAIALCHALIANPLRCMACNKELSPERLNLTFEQIDEIANWNGAYGSVYRLWLDSREYESWAKAELERADSPINLRGLKCCEALSEKWPTYLWWFLEHGEKRTACPKCKQKLTSQNGWAVCEACRILAPNKVS